MRYKLLFWGVSLVSSFLASCQTHVPESTPKTTEPMYTNALIEEASPYLLQHAHNPVNWLPWGQKAFDKAKEENKLMLISVGYSACHWCHVMEKESFENDEVAALMNTHFVCVKVDREERPDVDDVYMTAVQIMTQRGGWPLNCFTLPDGRPIYGGTYFPKNQWMQVLNSLSNMYQENPEQALDYAERLTSAVQSSALIDIPTETTPFQKESLENWVNQISKTFDEKDGGHQGAPKFPMPAEWSFLLEYASLTSNKDVLQHVAFTLEKMASGAMYDQLGGGFARYSVDAQWKIPHFEKMLYDNGQLLSVYALAYKQFQNPRFLEIAEQTAQFMLNELYDTESKGFWSALDADSEGVEGKFYTFTKDEYKSLLSEKEFDFAQEWLGISQLGYWEHQQYTVVEGASMQTLKATFNLSEQQVFAKKEVIQKKLMDYRNQRIRPGLDDKQIGSWNALAIVGYLDLYETTLNENWLNVALGSIAFVEENIIHKNGLNRYFKKGAQNIPATLEDYALVMQMFIKAYEVTGNEHYLNQSEVVLKWTNEKFKAEGTPYYNSSDASQDLKLISNPIDLGDNVIPSPNSIMGKNLFRLGTLTYQDKLTNRAAEMLQGMQEKVSQYPTGYVNWLSLYTWQAFPFNEVIITGKISGELKSKLQQHYLPNTQVSFSTEPSTVSSHQEKWVESEDLIYVCRNKSCLKPVTAVDEALLEIRKN